MEFRCLWLDGATMWGYNVGLQISCSSLATWLQCPLSTVCPTLLCRYWSADPSYARKFPLFISIDGEDQRTLLLASALHQATGIQVITRRCVRHVCSMPAVSRAVVA